MTRSSADAAGLEGSGSTKRQLTALIVVEPGLDGVFRHVEGLVAFLLDHEVRVHLAYSSRRCGEGMRNLVERVRRAGGEVVDLKITNYPEPRDLWALIKVVGIVRRIRPDVIHSHSSKAGVIGRVTSLLVRHRRSIYSPHAYYGMAKPSSLKIAFYNWVERVLGGHGQTIAISSDEAAFAQSTLAVDLKQIAIIHNPVDANRFSPATIEQRRGARVRLGLPEDALVLTTIGRMCWQKDPETAYAGVAPVCASTPELFFVHLGWGKWKKYLLDVGESLGMYRQFKIIDYTDDPRDIYHASDGLIVSSRYEAGWPLVLLEALASNLPIVAATGLGMSDIGGTDLSHVWTFPPELVPACTEAVKKWVSSCRSGLTECNHRSFAVEHLSPERCFGAVLKLYRGESLPEKISPLN